MSLEPIKAGTLINEWVEARQTEQDRLAAWHDVQSPELLTAWADAKIDLIEVTGQLELDLGIKVCTSLDGPYAP